MARDMDRIGLDVVVMAAGKGTRMRSRLPKVLHRLGGTSLVEHVLQTASAVGAGRIVVVVGHGADEVEAAVGAKAARPGASADAGAGAGAGAGADAGASADAGANADVGAGAGAGAELIFIRQEPQLGTGHAVLQAVPRLGDADVTLVLNGDVPLIEPATAAALVAACGGDRLALLTIDLEVPTGYGRIVRAAPADPGDGPDPDPAAEGAPAPADRATVGSGARRGAVRGIVEEPAASPPERRIREVYTGAMAAPTTALKRWLAALRNDNAQGEYYLTDVVAMAVAEGVDVATAQPASDTEVLGVNSPAQLAELERRLQRRRAGALMEAGVRLADPARLDIRGTLACGQDVEIDVNCVFEGRVELGDEVRIGPNCVIRDATIGRGAVIQAYTHIDGGAGLRAAPAGAADGYGVSVGADARVGPYARLRPGARLGREVHVGNFVEVKNSTLGDGAKANHLAYLGDATVGARVNFGAGSITANYDGVNKHRTTIGADVQVGSNCVLIAPVAIGDGATVGGGTTLARDAPAGQLTVARARQVSLPGWKRPVKVGKPR